MEKVESFLLLVGVFGLTISAGAIIYNILEESAEDE